MIECWIPLELYIIILCKHQLTPVGRRRYTSRIDPAYQCAYSNLACGMEVFRVTLGTRSVEEHDDTANIWQGPA